MAVGAEVVEGIRCAAVGAEVADAVLVGGTAAVLLVFPPEERRRGGEEKKGGRRLKKQRTTAQDELAAELLMGMARMGAAASDS